MIALAFAAAFLSAVLAYGAFRRQRWCRDGEKTQPTV
jgi:hypothetical protein